MENFERKYAPIELWSYFIDILAFELSKLCPGVGILFRFFRPGAGVLHWKAVPGAGFWWKNLVARQSARGGGGGRDGNQSNWYLHYSESKLKEREIFARRVMVDQAREGLCYQRKTLHFGVLNIEKTVRSVLTGLLLRKLCVFACCKSNGQWYVFIVVLSHGKLDLSFFFMAGPKSANLQHASPNWALIQIL